MSSKPKALTDDEREELLAAGKIVPVRLRVLDTIEYASGDKRPRSFGFHEKQRRRPAKVQHPKPVKA